MFLRTLDFSIADSCQAKKQDSQSSELSEAPFSASCPAPESDLVRVVGYKVLAQIAARRPSDARKSREQGMLTRHVV